MPFDKPYPVLRDFVSKPSEMDGMIQDAKVTVESEIGKQKGVTGAALRGSWRLARALAPDYVERLLTEFFGPSLDIMTPYYHEALDADRSVPAHFADNAERLADALLEMTDSYSAKDEDGPMKRTYLRIRTRMRERMTSSMGPLGELVERYLPPEWTPGRGT